MIDPDRLRAAYETARDGLLADREEGGHWVGELAASALATATAVSALSLVERHDATAPSGRSLDELRESRLSQFIVRGIRWLVHQQNEDGGWGDTETCYSNVATTMLAVAAFHLTGLAAEHADVLERAEQYTDQQGRIVGLRKRYGKDKTFAVPILTNCALAGLVDWDEVSPLPFEAACLPQRFYRFLKLPVVSYAIPALVAIGQARYFHKKPWNPLARTVRKLAVGSSMKVLRRMQPESGGYLEAVPLTSFVVMSLAATDRVGHPVVQSGVRFLVDSVRPNGSWPIDTNLATWNTTLALNALAAGGEAATQVRLQTRCLDWLLSCQSTQEHPFTGAAPGGWGWSDLSGSLPDADDSAGALLALSNWYRSDSSSSEDRERIQIAAAAGAGWLIDLQNSDGGWPTFCRGWGRLPFDRSGADLTAHVIRALWVWQRGTRSLPRSSPVRQNGPTAIQTAIERGFRFLERQQANDGSWVPLWFGNQDHPREENPVYGTAKVLMAYRDVNRIETPEAQRGFAWLCAAQNADGSWGAGPDRPSSAGSIEESALAIEALLSDPAGGATQIAAKEGLAWLVGAVEDGRHLESSPIGFYFAKLWYHEKLYPQIFTVSALGRALRESHLRLELKPAEARLND